METKANPKLSRRQFVVRSSLLTLGGLGVYAFGVEPRWISVEYHDLPIEGLPIDLDGATAVQISDTHVGSRVSDSFLLKQFDFVQSLNPEFVFFTGDYLDNGPSGIYRKGLDCWIDFRAAQSETLPCLETMILAKAVVELSYLPPIRANLSGNSMLLV